MAKKSEYMTRTERVGGTIFFLVYLFVLPLLSDRLFAFAEVLFDTTIGGSLRSVLFYYTLFAVTVLLFHRFLTHTGARFLDGLNRSFVTLAIGLVVFYGANELLYRLFRVLFDSQTNLNDMTITASISSAPRMTALIVVFLAPFVEEVLFRGLVFGCLRERSRVVAYAASCLLFALLHVWTFALSAGSMSYFTLMIQYLVPGLIFAWAFDHSGTLWTSILLHAGVNALSLWMILS